MVSGEQKPQSQQVGAHRQLLPGDPLRSRRLNLRIQLPGLYRSLVDGYESGDMPKKHQYMTCRWV